MESVPFASSYSAQLMADEFRYGIAESAEMVDCMPIDSHETAPMRVR